MANLYASIRRKNRRSSVGSLKSSNSFALYFTLLSITLSNSLSYEAAEKALGEAQEGLRQKEKHNEQIEDFVSEIEAMPDSITDFRTDY